VEHEHPSPLRCLDAVASPLVGRDLLNGAGLDAPRVGLCKTTAAGMAAASWEDMHTMVHRSARQRTVFGSCGGDDMV